MASPVAQTAAIRRFPLAAATSPAPSAVVAVVRMAVMPVLAVVPAAAPRIVVRAALGRLDRDMPAATQPRDAWAVAAARIQYAGEINYFLQDSAVSVDGMVESMIMATNAADAERAYLGYLKTNRDLVNDKMVIDGVNKSDFGVFNKALNLPAYLTSTGQQKTLLLNLILAHAKLIFTKTGATPIILLDEAVAHLDTDARARLFEQLADAHAQVWATGLDASVFNNIPNSTFVTCKDGTISNII